MLKHILAAAMATALITAPLAPAFAQAATEKSEKKAKKKTETTEQKLTAQQQKMKDCGPKWADYKKEKNVKGRAEYRKFMSTCLKAERPLQTHRGRRRDLKSLRRPLPSISIGRSQVNSMHQLVTLTEPYDVKCKD